jgi:hypothetical protein
MKTKKILLAILILFNISNYAQEVGDSGSLIQGGLDDGQKLLKAYLKPLNKALVFGLSDVTYTKFRDNDDSRKLSLALKLAYMPIAEEDFTYDVSKLGLELVEAKDPTNTIAPTVFGDSIKTIRLASKKKDLLNRPLFEFDAPTGGQTEALPLPFLGINYRLRTTNVAINFIPYVTVPTSDLKVGMLGVSIQQDLALFIEALKEKPLSISLQGSSALLYGNSELHVSPEGVTVPVTLNGSTPGPYDDQEVNIFYTSMQFGAYFDYTIAKKYTLFAGGAYNSGSSRLLVSGTYPIYAEDTSTPIGSVAVVASDVVDPIDIEDSFNRIKYEIGARADWKKFYLQVNYNIATYGGVGFNLGYKMF